MAVNIIPIIPIIIVVTTWPLARVAAAPKRGIGAVGWIRIMPYKTSDDSPRTLFSPGPDDWLTLMVEGK
jgi:hypothetical protein